MGTKFLGANIGIQMLKKIFTLIYKLQYKIYDIKAFYYSKLFKDIGINIKFFSNFHIKNPQNISIGSNATFNDGAYLNGLGGIDIGNNVSVSALSIIVSTGLDHKTLKTSKNHINKKIIIGNNVQIGVGAIILSGITIGNNVIVGAGSVVTKNINSDCVVVGNPAKVIRELK